MRIGEFKARIFRVMQYASLITAPSVILTVVKVYGFRWYWALLALPFVLLAYWVDPKIQKGETKYSNDNNEEWQKHREDIAEILKLLRDTK
jgi:hypothetical protein